MQNVVDMAKIIGFCQVLAREGRSNEEEVPQCRRLEASTSRQKATIVVEDDIQHVLAKDHKEAYDEPHERVVQDVPTSPLCFRNGPHDTSILTCYTDHVSTKVREWYAVIIVIICKNVMS